MNSQKSREIPPCNLRILYRRKQVRRENYNLCVYVHSCTCLCWWKWHLCLNLFTEYLASWRASYVKNTPRKGDKFRENWFHAHVLPLPGNCILDTLHPIVTRLIEYPSLSCHSTRKRVIKFKRFFMPRSSFVL